MQPKMQIFHWNLDNEYFEFAYTKTSEYFETVQLKNADGFKVHDLKLQIKIIQEIINLRKSPLYRYLFLIS